MHVDYALLADTATSGGGGKLNIVGTFNSIGVRDFPAQHSRMALVVRLEGHITEEGRHTLEIEYVNQDGEKLGGPPPIEFELSANEATPGVPLSQQLVMQIDDLPLPEAGNYEFAIKVDGSYLDSVPLYVRKVEAAPPQGG